MSPDLSAVENEFILYLQILHAFDDFPILYSSYGPFVLLELLAMLVVHLGYGFYPSTIFLSI